MGRVCRISSANRSLGVIVGCAVLITASCLFAQDWPQWRGANRDGKATGFTAPQTWPQSLVQKWKTTVGSGDATPALVAEKLYVFTRQGGDEVTLCLSADDGSQLWEDKYAAQAVTGAASRHPGPRSSPAVADGKVVTLGVGGVLSCLNTADGKLVWRKDPFPKVVPMFFTASSPIIVDGLAVAQLGGRGKGAIIAYDLATGDEKWRWDAEGPEYASPAVLIVDGAAGSGDAGAAGSGDAGAAGSGDAGAKQIVALTDKSVVGVGLSDGKLLWRLPFTPQRRAYNAATPIIDGQTVIYTGAGRGATAVKIEKQGDGFAAKEVWSNPELAPQFNTPVLSDGLLFGLSNQGNLYCINAETGQTAWTDATARDRSGFGSIVQAGSVLMALPSSAELIVYAPSDKQFTELARIKVADTAIYAHPVVAGKRVFVKDEGAVTMWTIE